MPKKERMIIHSLLDIFELSYPIGSHMDEVIQFMDRMKPIISDICKKLLNVDSNTTIAIWCRGSSGAILASLLSVILYSNGINNVIIKHVKKPGETSHGNNYNRFANYNIIIDDFSCSGVTINQITNKMYDTNVRYIDCLILSGLYITLKNSLSFTIPKMLIIGELSKDKIKLLKKLVPKEIKDYKYDSTR